MFLVGDRVIIREDISLERPLVVNGMLKYAGHVTEVTSTSGKLCILDGNPYAWSEEELILYARAELEESDVPIEELLFG